MPHTGWPARTIFDVRMPLPGTDDRPGFDPRLVADAHLPADHRVILHYHAAGESGLRRDYDIAPDAAIVAHMYQVVDFGAIAD